MSRHRHKKHRKSASIELNVTAMLDMAFQLLAFFILTFRPVPVEGQLAMNLPPPVAQTQEGPKTETPDNGTGVHTEETVDLHVTASSAGRVQEIKIGPRAIVQGGFDAAQQNTLKSELAKIFAIKGKFDRVQIIAEGRLLYGDLMKIIEICSKQKMHDGTLLQKISFIEKDAEEVN